MQIQVTLFSIFREKLPPEKRGKTTLFLPTGATLSDLLDELDIHITAISSVNGRIEYDHSFQLNEGDEVQIFRPVGGGSH